MDERLWGILTDSFPKMLEYAVKVTIPLTVLSFALALVVALGVALIQYARIRVLQNRTIKQDDIVLLEQAATYEARTTRPYRITRAFHGMEDATLITDLTLEVVMP